MSFEDNFKKNKKEHGIKDSAGFLRLKEGDNKMRILTEPQIVVSRYGKGVCYKGCGYCNKDVLEKENAKLTYKYMAWIYHIESDKLYLYSIPYTIVSELVELKKDPEYAFEKFPMPFDVNIKADENVGTKKVKYTLLAARKNSEISAEILEQLESETPVEKVIQAMKDKQAAEDGGVKDYQGDNYPEAEDEGIDLEKQDF